jgi:hypothetical protein
MPPLLPVLRTEASSLLNVMLPTTDMPLQWESHLRIYKNSCTAAAEMSAVAGMGGDV